jgi:SmpA / OmlA family
VRPFLVIATAFMLCACSSMIRRSLTLQPGMSRHEVRSIMGTPAGRSFRADDEAWQYQQIAGFGQCAYVTVWFRRSHVVGVTERRGPSIAGCGLGSHAVDWAHMPTPSE